MKPGWRGWRADAIREGSPSKVVVLSDWDWRSEEGVGLLLRSWEVEKRPSSGEVGGEVGEVGRSCELPFDGVEPGGASLKMCTVSVAEETQSKVEVALKLMQYIRAGMLPRRNW